MATFTSVLSSIGTGLKDFFDKLLPIAVAAEPIIDVAFPGIGALYNTTVAMVINAEIAAAAAGKQNGTGPQKLAAVVQALTPIATQYLASQGITADQAQITAWVNAVVASLNALPASTTQPVTAATA